MRKGILAVAAIGAVALSGMAACGSSNNNDNSSGSNSGSNAKQPFVGVILPDTKSSARWETADRRTSRQAFKAAGVKLRHPERPGRQVDSSQTIADQMLTQGVNVLMIVNLDAGSGAAVIKQGQAAGRRRTSTTTA